MLDYSEKEILEAVKTGREHCEGRYTFAKYRRIAKELDLPSGYAVIKLVGWNNAKEKAGLNIYKHSRKYDREELREEYENGATLDELCEEYGIRKDYLKKLLDDLIDGTPRICKDCIHKPSECEENIEDCIKEAEIYGYFE